MLQFQQKKPLKQQTHINTNDPSIFIEIPQLLSINTIDQAYLHKTVNKHIKYQVFHLKIKIYNWIHFCENGYTTIDCCYYLYNESLLNSLLKTKQVCLCLHLRYIITIFVIQAAIIMVCYDCKIC